MKSKLTLAIIPGLDDKLIAHPLASGKLKALSFFNLAQQYGRVVVWNLEAP